MRITVFGATGKTGQEILKQAIARGHSVHALVRDPARLGAPSDRLTHTQGNILDPVAVKQALAQPADAVVSALGIFHRKPRTELSEGTRNIVQAMEEAGVTRLAVVSSLGAGDSKGQGNFIARNLQRLLLSHVLDDKNRQEVVIRDSQLDFTIIRPPQLTDGKTICKAVVEWQGPSPKAPKLSWKTSRATVA
ncbi:MAG: NAD(P)-dependent oxidoreductase, partial [Gammaproteobacteria bacterium]